MDLTKLEGVLKSEPAYRFKQAKEAVYKNLINDWQEALNLPADLRNKLNQEIPLTIKAEISATADNKSIKAAIALADGLKIETVLLNRPERKTVCVSSQVGCSLGCNFCATGQMGFKRNLTSQEIVEQVFYWARYLKNNFQPAEKITNIVYMGMGEPFLNYDNVLASIRILNDSKGLGIGIRHFSISTVGLTEGILRLASEKEQINLAISLHAPDGRLRSKLMPINEKYPIKEIINAVDQYLLKTKRKVMFEYLLIKDVNDSVQHAIALAKLMKKPLYMVNLITYNPTGIFQPPVAKTIREFKEILEKAGVVVTQRLRLGRGVKGACGQLIN